MTNDLRAQFLLDPAVAYLNHGSFGACPRPVFEVYQNWQRELERQPVDFFNRRVRSMFSYERGGLLDDARAALARYINAPVDDLLFTINATVALNTVARSFPLQPGDEVLTTNNEYGTIEAAWLQACKKSGAKLVRNPLALPATTHADFVESFWAAVTPRTRVILLSHITSTTALILPIAEICRRARAGGIITVIDGAHAIGQIPLDIAAIDPDFYTSNCHKWLCAPKGSAFLYVHPKQQAALEPLVISWAWVDRQPFSIAHEMWGTRDIAAFLSVPAAIEFQQQHDWDAVRARCHAMLLAARQRLIDLIGLPPLAPSGRGWLAQMASVALPASCDPHQLWHRLYHDYRVEALAFAANDKNLLRISVQGYNTGADLDRLYAGLKELLDS